MNAFISMNGRNGKGAAPAAPELYDTTLPLSELLVTNRHSGITIRSFRPLVDADALRETAACDDLFNRVLNSEAGRPYLFVFEPVDFIERGAHLISVRDGERVVGTMHFHRDAMDKLTLRAAAVDSRYSGQKIAGAMGATAILHDAVANGPVEEIYCAVRVLPDGTLNEPSKVSFARLGFMLETEIGITYVDGSFRNRHLLPGVEFADDGRMFTRYRRMTAGPDILPRARAFLSAWSQAILPFPKS